MLFLQTRQLQRRDGGDLFISFLQRTVFAQSCSTDEPWERGFKPGGRGGSEGGGLRLGVGDGAAPPGSRSALRSHLASSWTRRDGEGQVAGAVGVDRTSASGQKRWRGGPYQTSSKYKMIYQQKTRKSLF